jgi:general secretion pathway protein D
MDEISLEVEAEFKLLTGQSSNGIPVISNRKLQSKVSLRSGEWAVVGGLMSTTEAKTLAGFAGLSRIPGLGKLLSKNTRDDQGSEVLILLRPVLLTATPDQFATRTLFVGSADRLEIPL